MPKTLNDLLTEWHAVTLALGPLVQQEKELRTQIFEMAVPMLKEQNRPELKRGDNKLRIDHGMALILDHRINYRIDRAGLEATLTAATDNERAVIESVVSYSPSIRDAKFEALAGDDLKLITPFVTASPGLPGLEIKPQNKVRW